MRSNCFKGDKLNKAVKILDRIMSVILALFLITLTFGWCKIFIEKKYVYPLKYQDVIFEYSNRYELDKTLVFAVVKVESGFNSKAVSSAGAVGLMQLTPDTAEYIAKKLKVEKYDLTDADTNVWFGCYYLDYLYQRFNSMNTVICAYNGGEGNVTKWLSNKEYSNDGKTLYNIPFKETQEYLEKIQKSYKKYNKLYGNILDKQKIFE